MAMTDAEKVRKYRALHPGAAAAAARRWRLKYPERHKASKDRWYAKNRLRSLAKGRQWKIRNPERAREIARWAHLKHAFGLSKSEYESLVSLQGGLCAICKNPNKKRLCVDHRHSDGKVRGLLCHGCNNALGNFNEDITIIHRLIEYLERP